VYSQVNTVARRVVTIRFSKPEYEFIAYMADRWGVSMSEAVRIILHEFIGMAMIMSNMPEARHALIQLLAEKLKGINGGEGKDVRARQEDR